MAGGEETAHAPVKAAWLSLHPKLTAFERLRSRPRDAVVSGFVAGVCSRGHVLDETRLADLLSPLASRNGFAKGDGSAFARKLASDYAADAQVRYALETVARILRITEADSATRERFREAVEMLMQGGNNAGRRQ